MLATLSHVRFEFTNTKKLVKKLARIEASSICCQQFANLFADCFCTFHTYQHEFADTSLPTLVCLVKAALDLPNLYYLAPDLISASLLGATDLLFTYHDITILQFRPKKMQWQIVVNQQEIGC